MNRRIFLSSAAILAVAIAIGTPTNVYAESDGEVETIQVVTKSSHIGELRFLRVNRNGENLWMTGTIKKRVHSRIRGMGHVDLEFLNRAGDVVSTQTVRIPPGWGSRNKRWYRFSAIVNKLPAEIEVVRISHDPGVLIDDMPC